MVLENLESRALCNYFEIHREERRLFLELNEPFKEREPGSCPITISIILNQKNLNEQNETLFRMGLINRRALSLYLLGIFSFRHADALVDTRHKFSRIENLSNYKMAITFAALLESWVKSLYGASKITSKEPSWFMEDDTEFNSYNAKNFSVLDSKHSGFRHGFMYSNNHKVGISIEKHYNQLLQLSLTVEESANLSPYIWHNQLDSIATAMKFSKMKNLESIFTISYPLLAQHYRIYRIMIYRRNSLKILPTIYQRIFSSRTEEVWFNNQKILSPLKNWDRVLSEFRR